MKVATKANVRTTQAARTSIGKALEIAFAGGSVMGLGVVGLGVLGLGGLMIIYGDIYGMSTQENLTKVITIITGFSLVPLQLHFCTCWRWYLYKSCGCWSRFSWQS